MTDIKSNHAYHIQSLIEQDDEAQVVYAEVAYKLEKEVERLKGAIQTHKESVLPDGCNAYSADIKLWEVLEGK
jgi:cob(I)alamin adenosyltransferase